MLSFLQPKRNRRALALLLAAALVLSPLSALAGTYEIENGSITVSNDGSGQTVTQAGKYDNEPDAKPVITNRDPDTPSTNTVTLNAGAGATVEVTIQDLHIDNSGDPNDEYDGGASFTTTGDGDVVIELDGENTLTAGCAHAGLQKENGGTLTIQNENETDGSLTATGGKYAAGIGGGRDGDGTDITVTGGTVTANGGDNGAGIGGGMGGDGTDITVSGGTVTANGGDNGAGIGGGVNGSGSKITIENGTVTTSGGDCGAGIGGGMFGNGTDITIEDGTVTTSGGYGGAGIGGGLDNSAGDDGEGNGTSITIIGGEVTANGGSGGAGIGGGFEGNGSAIKISGGTVIAVSPSGFTAGAGVGGGRNGTGYDIAVSGAAQVSVACGETEATNGLWSPATAIGSGSLLNQTDSIEVQSDTADLSCGTITYYEAGTTAEEIKNGTGTLSEKHDPNPVCGSGHKAGTPQKENETAGDCTTDNEYDLVTYCTLCSDKLSTEHVNNGKVADAHDWQAATCTEPKTCSRCQAKEGAALGHTWTPATCTEPKTCSVCKATEGAALGHTPGAAVKEKEVAPTEDTEGSYEAVVYCTVCGTELSREKKTVQKLSHVHTEVTDPAKAPTCTETGLTEGKQEGGGAANRRGGQLRRGGLLHHLRCGAEPDRQGDPGPGARPGAGAHAGGGGRPLHGLLQVLGLPYPHG